MTSARDSRGGDRADCDLGAPASRHPGMRPEEGRARPDPRLTVPSPVLADALAAALMRGQRRDRVAARSVAGRRDHCGCDCARRDDVPANTEPTNGTIGGLSFADETSSTGAGSYDDGTAFTPHGTCII